MKVKSIVLAISIFHVLFFSNIPTGVAHDIIFCGERIPVHNNFVAEKLMDVIRRQIPTVNLPLLRKRVESNFPVVEYYLRETGLPEDFKYLAIVESGFQNLTSSAGARGFWQLMPETAKELGLVVSSVIDERDNIYKSTYAACKILASYYLNIKKKYGVSSWVLTAAAYNFGIGNISSAVNIQGNDYFSMNLNKETALYVYKIIAVKELFEFPELYMKDFGYNVFNVVRTNSNVKPNASTNDSTVFTSMVVNVSSNDGQHPPDLVVAPPSAMKSTDATQDKKGMDLDRRKFKYVPATIKGKYKDFEDGNLIEIELLENLEVKGSFNRKGNRLKGNGWVIGSRIYIDLGYGAHDVTLVDTSGEKGIADSALRNNERILLKVSSSTE